jgi:hypothetical protein
MLVHGEFSMAISLYSVTQATHSVYCIVFLISLFLSSYSWAPVPASELQTAVSTFENLTYNGKPVLSYLPPMIQLLDRPWVDNSYGGLFQSFNVTQWEIDSVRHSITKAIRTEKKAAELLAQAEIRANQSSSSNNNSTEGSQSVENVPISTVTLYLKSMDALQRSWFSFLEIATLPRYAYQYGLNLLKTSSNGGVSSTSSSVEHSKKQRRPRKPVVAKPFWFGLRTAYDLNPYGFDVVIRLWPMDD